MASGSHFAIRQSHAAVCLPFLGFDGIGQTEDGRLIGFGGMKPPYGSMAENAAIPSAVSGSYSRWDRCRDGCIRAQFHVDGAVSAQAGARKLQPGETVLVNGATGFAGRLAIQVAKLLGAERIVGTGRDDDGSAITAMRSARTVSLT